VILWSPGIVFLWSPCPASSLRRRWGRFLLLEGRCSDLSVDRTLPVVLLAPVVHPLASAVVVGFLLCVPLPVRLLPLRLFARVVGTVLVEVRCGRIFFFLSCHSLCSLGSRNFVLRPGYLAPRPLCCPFEWKPGLSLQGTLVLRDFLVLGVIKPRPCYSLGTGYALDL